MSFEIIFVLLGLIGMLVALILDKMRPGIVLLSLVVLFMVAGIIVVFGGIVHGGGHYYSEADGGRFQ